MKTLNLRTLVLAGITGVLMIGGMVPCIGYTFEAENVQQQLLPLFSRGGTPSNAREGGYVSFYYHQAPVNAFIPGQNYYNSFHYSNTNGFYAEMRSCNGANTNYDDHIYIYNNTPSGSGIMFRFSVLMNGDYPDNTRRYSEDGEYAAKYLMREAADQEVLAEFILNKSVNGRRSVTSAVDVATY